MKISFTNRNCDFKTPYLIDISPESSVEITFEFDKIVSVQSRKKLQDSLLYLIASELRNFEWLILGKVQIEVHWFLNAVEKQETDKVGDLDNITKPLIDALSGIDALLIDDSQINSIHYTWTSKNGMIKNNLVKLIIIFNNEYTISKRNLYFLQTSSVIYTPLNFDLNDKKELERIKFFIEAFKLKRTVAENIKSKLDINVDRYLIYSEWEFHRTRLSGFNQNQIIKDADFDAICQKQGIDTLNIINQLKSNSGK